MSETEKTAETAEAGLDKNMDRVKKMSLASLGGGRKPSPDEMNGPNRGAFIGTIRGEATGFATSRLTNPTTGEVTEFTGLSGVFYGTSANPKIGNIRSTLLYLPGGFHEEMLDVVAPIDPASNERKVSGNTVSFVFDFYTEEAQNQSGFAWRIVPLGEQRKNEAEDTLSRLIALEREGRAARNKALISSAASSSHATGESTKGKGKTAA